MEWDYYHVDKRLQRHWFRHSLKVMKQKNVDRVYIVDGRERIGKSSFAIQQMCFLEPELLEDKEEFIKRICFTAEEFNKVVRETQNGVVVFDEAFRGLSSRASLSKINKKLIQTLMEMGLNNNIVFIVLPSIFLLDIYPALLRSDGLFHIIEDKKTKRRAFYCYNRSDKNKLWQKGARKGWYYPNPKMRGRFYGIFPQSEKYKEFGDIYDKKKQDVFKREEEEEQKIPRIKFDRKQIALNLKEKGYSIREIGKIMNMTHPSILKLLKAPENPVLVTGSG